MPHDRDGRELKVGDEVLVPCVVKSVQPRSDHCNLIVETLLPMFPADDKMAIILNATQVVLRQAVAEPTARA